MQKRWRKWLRRGLWYTALVLVVMVITAVIMAYQASRVPDWYRPDAMTVQQREKAARQAEVVWAKTQNWVAESEAAVRREVVRHPGSMKDIAPSDEPFDIELTGDEINAAMGKWAVVYDARGRMDQYLTHPTVVLRKGQVILAGEVQKSGPFKGRVLSLHLEPTIKDDGKLDINLVSLKVGLLPVAHAIWASESDRVTNSIYRNLSSLQKKAKLQSTGDANGDAVGAALALMAVRTLENQPVDPVVFVQLADGRHVPVIILKIEIMDGDNGGLLRLTVCAMSQKQREEFVDHLKTSGRPAVVNADLQPTH